MITTMTTAMVTGMGMDMDINKNMIAKHMGKKEINMPLKRAMLHLKYSKLLRN